MSYECGECQACCKLMAVEELKKPGNRWCSHIVKARGCGIYETRPPSCREFACVWLASGEHAEGLPAELRPDRCHVMFVNNEAPPPPGIKRPPGTLVTLYVDPGYPLAHRAPAVELLVATLIKHHYRVLALVGNKGFVRLGSEWHRCILQMRGTEFSGVYDAILP